MTTGRMLPTERLDVDIKVLVDDTWWPGVLEHRRQAEQQWEGFVRWSTGPGENRVSWYPYDRLRVRARR
ncbi:hypothetical protein [Nocardioides mesophilus]|uniref:Uncharacterized protein n=1 Tax=Nocardioides mesophilus TaxID=433659 RepID=A0A7G9RGH8_9ACTN|nr:hypothetical protein [Nocardioides mesophilus]QNN54703.1 hypothetical protein H9L09_10620 [Nocardioides mesophilus]